MKVAYTKKGYKRTLMYSPRSPSPPPGTPPSTPPVTLPESPAPGMYPINVHGSPSDTNSDVMDVPYPPIQRHLRVQQETHFNSITEIFYILVSALEPALNCLIIIFPYFAANLKYRTNLPIKNGTISALVVKAYTFPKHYFSTAGHLMYPYSKIYFASQNDKILPARFFQKLLESLSTGRCVRTLQLNLHSRIFTHFF